MKKLNLICIISLFLILCSPVFGLLSDYTESYYSFDNNNLIDLTGNGYTGTDYGTLYSILGKIYNTSSYDGVADYFIITGLPVSTLKSSSVWVYRDDEESYDTIYDTYTQDKFTLIYRGGSENYYKAIYNGQETRCYNYDNASEWINLVMIYDNPNLMIYANNNLCNTTNIGSQSVSNSDLYVAKQRLSGNYFGGFIDELGFYDQVLTLEDVSIIWNKGLGLQYPFITNFTITTQIDNYNISMISNETLNYNNANITQITNINLSDTRLWNITLSSNIEGYESTRNFTNYNISLNGSLVTSFRLLNINLTFDAKEIMSNNSLYPFNITLENGSMYTITSNTTSVMVDYGQQDNITFSKINYYDLINYNETTTDDSLIVFNGVYNSIMNITANAFNGGSQISGFNGYIYNSLYDYNVSFTALGNNGYAYLLNNYEYDVYIIGNSTYSSNNKTVTINSTNFNVNLILSLYNSVNINIFNESSRSLISQLVTITSITDNLSFINTTSNGNITLPFLSPANYELRFSSNNFYDRSVFITVTNDSTQMLNVYMVENTSTDLQPIQVLDTANQPVEGAIVWLQKEQLNSSTQWLTIGELLTDYNGKTATYVTRSLSDYYRFAVIYNGVSLPIQPSGNYYTGKTLFIPGVEETVQLIVSLEGSDNDYISDLLNITTNVYYGGLDNNIVYFDFLDGRNSIVGGKLVIRGKYLDSSFDYEDLSTQTLSGSSGTINYTFPIQNNTIYEITAYLQYSSYDKLIYQVYKEYESDEKLEKNTGIILAIPIIMLVALLTASLGPLVGGIFTFGSVFVVSYFGFVNIPVTIVTSFIALIIIVFLKPKRDGDIS